MIAISMEMNLDTLSPEQQAFTSYAKNRNRALLTIGNVLVFPSFTVFVNELDEFFCNSYAIEQDVPITNAIHFSADRNYPDTYRAAICNPDRGYTGLHPAAVDRWVRLIAASHENIPHPNSTGLRDLPWASTETNVENFDGDGEHAEEPDTDEGPATNENTGVILPPTTTGTTYTVNTMTTGTPPVTVTTATAGTPENPFELNTVVHNLPTTTTAPWQDAMSQAARLNAIHTEMASGWASKKFHYYHLSHMTGQEFLAPTDKKRLNIIWVENKRVLPEAEHPLISDKEKALHRFYMGTGRYTRTFQATALDDGEINKINLLIGRNPVVRWRIACPFSQCSVAELVNNTLFIYHSKNNILLKHNCSLNNLINILANLQANVSTTFKLKDKQFLYWMSAGDPADNPYAMRNTYKLYKTRYTYAIGVAPSTTTAPTKVPMIVQSYMFEGNRPEQHIIPNASTYFAIFNSIESSTQYNSFSNYLGLPTNDYYTRWHDVNVGMTVPRVTVLDVDGKVAICTVPGGVIYGSILGMHSRQIRNQLSSFTTHLVNHIYPTYAYITDTSRFTEEIRTRQTAEFEKNFAMYFKTGFTRAFREITEKYNRALENVTEYSKKLEDTIREATSLESIVKTTDIEKMTLTKAAQELEQIKKLKPVEHIWINRNALIFETKPLKVKDPRTKFDHYIGKVKVTIDPTANYSVMFDNMTKKIYGMEANMHAPHVFATGSPCLGSISKIVPDLLGSSSYVLLIDTLVQFLTSVNTADTAGRYVHNWPMIKTEEPLEFYTHAEAKELIRQKQPAILELYRS